MNQADLEREARELLAAEYERERCGSTMAEILRAGERLPFGVSDEHIRAIVAALRKPQQEAVKQELAIPQSECPICREWAAKFGPCGYHARHAAPIDGQRAVDDGLTNEQCVAVYDAVSRSNLTRDVKTAGKKIGTVRGAIAALAADAGKGEASA